MAKGKYQYWLTPEGLLKLESWARDGLTDEQLAKNMGINPATLYEWKKKYSEISETLKRGKEVVDIQVENALLKRALGYDYEEETKEMTYATNEFGEALYNAMGNRITTLSTVKSVKKQVAPDTTAQIFWLKNRRPDKWRDRKDVDVTGSLEHDVNIIIGGEDFGD